MEENISRISTLMAGILVELQRLWNKLSSLRGVPWGSPPQFTYCCWSGLLPSYTVAAKSI
ncbi:hypothetical protein SLEP1_g29715 [Rubroshorea leprosula]|uniref:Uncharacterized protein n=1 Tax=Rubroshorea leprosula TaxID=152421 RepID=A0AAV5K6P4_9ROSI|nr:hypothetical protein SLEP1_g29715 [Rubroshorea leprosula]